MRSLLAGLSLVALLATAATAQPDVDTIVANMKKSLEPARPSVRTIELVTSSMVRTLGRAGSKLFFKLATMVSTSGCAAAAVASKATRDNPASGERMTALVSLHWPTDKVFGNGSATNGRCRLLRAAAVHYNAALWKGGGVAVLNRFVRRTTSVRLVVEPTFRMRMP